MNNKIIESLMQQQGLSLSKLSVRTGIQKSTLSRILRGDTANPNPDTIRAIADYFSIPISEILVDTEINLKTSLKPDTLPNNLRALMLNASILSARDLSRMTGIATSNIERILNGTTHNPHLSTLNQLASYFGITISQLRGNEALDNIDTGQINPSFCHIPVLSLANLTQWLEGKMTTAPKCVNTARKIMGKQSFSILIPDNTYLTDFKKNYILVVDSDAKPENGDFVVASIQKAPPSIYEYFLEDDILLREAGKEEYKILDQCIYIYGIVVEIKLKD